MEFAKMLPVEWENCPPQRAIAGRVTTLALTAQGRNEPCRSSWRAMTRRNAEVRWEKFPQVHWINRVTCVKAGAQTLPGGHRSR